MDEEKKTLRLAEKILTATLIAMGALIVFLVALVWTLHGRR